MKDGNRDKNLKIIFTKLFIYIVLFNVAVLCTVVVLHEMGHFVTATSVSDCQGSVILFDTVRYSPYTSLECEIMPKDYVLYLSSFLFLLPYSLLFLALSKFPERHYFLVVLGVSIFSASLDIKMLTRSDLMFGLTFVIGIFIYLIGEYLLVDKTFNRFEAQFYSKGEVY